MQKLRQKVAEIIEQLVHNNTADIDTNIAEEFVTLRKSLGTSPTTDHSDTILINFCDFLMGNLRAQLEDLFDGFVFTAQDHARRNVIQNDPKQRTPHKIHISRRGSVNISLGN